MYKLIIIFLFLLFSVNSYSQNSAYNKTILKDFGTWSVENGEHLVSVSAFLTIEKEIDVIHENEKEKAEIVYGETKYHYELYIVSKSKYNGELTNTWLYGVKVYINGENIYEQQFPDGFLASIKTDPTLIHTHHAFDKDAEFEVTWEKAIYEPRIRN